MTFTNKTLIALAVTMAAFGASAQVDKAASNAADAVQHKVDQKRAEDKAATSGPIGKAVNNTKAEYHKKMAEKDTKDAKDAVEHKVEQKRAEDKAAASGPIGKAVNNTKAEYHKGMAEHNAKEAKEALTPKK